MFLNDPFPGAFGLEIGDLTVKLVQLHRHHRLGRPDFFSPETMRSIGLPTGVIINGEIQQPEIVRQKIQHLLGKDGAYPRINSPWVVSSLPEPQTFLKLIDIPTPAKDLALDEVSFHASKHLPFELQDTYLDWQVLNLDKESDENSQILICAVPKAIADSYTYLLEASELHPIALEAEALSISRTLITNAKDYVGIARALLRLSGSRSSIIIFDHDSIQFSKNLNFSGELLTTAITQGLKIEREEAEKIKTQIGLKYFEKYPNYLKIVDDLVTGLTDEIKEALHFYKEHFPDTNPITHVTMCGGTSSLIGLDTVLSQKLRISARPGNVWKNLAPQNVLDNLTEEERRRGLSFAATIGLALRAVQNPLLNL